MGRSILVLAPAPSSLSPRGRGNEGNHKGCPYGGYPASGLSFPHKWGSTPAVLSPVCHIMLFSEQKIPLGTAAVTPIPPEVRRSLTLMVPPEE